ncbi:hypothetical protein K431DRAFT_230797 [Polychaeton citri CBS 116435]|uniref:Luciferase domain-containing protein n=1 Tax=Polychaeton citri CBS 116435 TaxID=1314669 RepID=A0A9P4Q2Q7_9PEZI|nr:hypothetical protein K431DRAFT_230797 [Polychaeton citri CBS 116435]
MLAGASISAFSTAWVYWDFSDWKAFGTGGTPPTWQGYWRMTKLRLLCAFSNDNLRDPSPLNKDKKSKSFLPSPLPVRQTPRPKMLARTMPQRQEPEPLDSTIRARLHDIPKKFVESRSDVLVLDLSKTEGRSTDAIYAKPSLPGRDASAKDRILGDEIAHVHPSENSLHVWLSEADAAEVTAKGWGERFPLGALGMCHAGWVMVYAPKSDADVDVIERIVKAGVAFLTGEIV